MFLQRLCMFDPPFESDKIKARWQVRHLLVVLNLYPIPQELKSALKGFVSERLNKY